MMTLDAALNEVDEIFRRNKNGEPLFKTLWAAGYHRVGRGRYGQVLAKKDSPIVVKCLFGADYGYEIYASLVVRSKSKHAPKIYKTYQQNLTREPKTNKWLKDHAPRCFVLERLKREGSEAEANRIERAVYYFMDHPHAKCYTPDFSKTMLPLVKSIAKTCERKLWSGSLDIHSGNIMYRSDGTLVITDPFVD